MTITFEEGNKEYNKKDESEREKEKEKNEILLLKKVTMLPEELVDIIYEYVLYKVKIFLTKDMYIFNHYLIRSFIKRNKIEDYFRTTIRKDNDYVFKILLYENYKNWIEIKQYYYKGQVFLNYLYFVRAYCYDNYSEKCIEIIKKFFIEQGLQKNLHKKKTTQYIKWTL